MSKPTTTAMDPLIEGYLSYLDKVGRKTPAHDCRCALHAAPCDRRARSGAARR